MGKPFVLPRYAIFEKMAASRACASIPWVKFNLAGVDTRFGLISRVRAATP